MSFILGFEKDFGAAGLSLRTPENVKSYCCVGWAMKAVGNVLNP